MRTEKRASCFSGVVNMTRLSTEEMRGFLRDVVQRRLGLNALEAADSRLGPADHDRPSNSLAL